MHFSNGQIAFVIAFIAAFIIALVWAYRRDRPVNSKHYKATWKVLITLIIVITSISLILRYLRPH
jgi:hypothetical protein